MSIQGEQMRRAFSKTEPKPRASKTTDITIGADPELFAFDPGGVPVSVHGMLPGHKWRPLVVPRGAIQVDGVAAEFNIDPATKRTEFMRNIRHVRNLMEALLKKSAPELALKATPCAFFPKEYFDSLPDDVKALGCEPDFNAYTRTANPKPFTEEPFRTGSGHIHVGWTENNDCSPEGAHFEECCEITKEFDFTLYNSSLIWDKDDKRRELYGQPGSFRPKSYGVEYRVLSNAWIDVPNLQMFVFDTTKAVAERFFKGSSLVTKWAEKQKTDKVENFREFCDFLATERIPTINNYM